MSGIYPVVLCLLSVGFQGQEEKIHALLKEVKGVDAKVRYRALSRLANLPTKPRTVVPTLIALLNSEKDPEMRKRLIGAISYISFLDDRKELRPLEEVDEKILRGIAPYLNDKAIEVQQSAMGALGRGRAKSKFAVKEVMEFLKHDDLNTRMMSAMCLASIGPDAATALPLLRSELEKRNAVLKNYDNIQNPTYTRDQIESLQSRLRWAIGLIENKQK